MSDLASRLANLSPEKRALLEKRLQEPVGRPAAVEPIAIIGMACRFPGAANPEAFWRLVESGGDAVRDVPPSRWDAAAIYDGDTSRPATTNSRSGGFLDDIDRFDAPFFGISPREASRMDPQQRLFLEVAWDALDDAGQNVEALGGSDTGVFVGLHSHACDYFWFDVPHLARMDSFTGPGTSHNMVPGRLSYLFDFQGPALVVDTACSSSLVAIHLACQALRNGESGLALAGGVNLVLSPVFTIALSRLGMLSPDGRCRAFDAGANGFVRSEGCGVIALKRLSDAQAAGDRVLAVIRGSAINQDGRTNGITAPSSPSQQRVIARALANAGVTAAQIGYVEAHGTGTELGDPIEAEALAAMIGRPTSDGAPCFLGSAKANVGHLEGAAGVAGVIKTVLALQHRTIPPLALFRKLNPHITLEGTRLQVPTTARPWHAPQGRFAGVSSFGWSGTNAHVVIEEPPAAPSLPVMDEGTGVVLPLSARSQPALRQLAAKYVDRLEARDVPLSHLAAAAAVRRTHHDCRLAVAGRSTEELLSALRAHLAGDAVWSTSAGRAVAGRRAPVAFVFSGQGSQWAGMGRELLASNAAFRGVIQRVDELLYPLAGWSLLAEITAEQSHSRLEHTAVAQPALFAVQVALAAAYEAIGIEPVAVTGHSVGEVAAAYVAGALALEEAVRVIFHRARLMERATGHGRMVAVELAVGDAQQVIAREAARVSIAAVNAPRSCVLSGDPTALGEIVARLERDGVMCRPLPVNYAFHSVQMEELALELRRELGTVAARSCRIAMVSTVTGEVIDGAMLDATYWARNVRQPVLFARAIDVLMARGQRLFLEVGPHPVLTSSIRLSMHDGAPPTAVPSLQRGKPDATALMASIGALYTQGFPINWSNVYGKVPAIPLPGYPWQRAQYWLPPATELSTTAPLNDFGAMTAMPGTVPVAEGASAPIATEQWIPLPAPHASGGSKRRRLLLLPDREGVGSALAKKLELAGHTCIVAGDREMDANAIAKMVGDASEQPLAAIVHLRTLDGDIAASATASEMLAAQRDGYGSVLALLQASVHVHGPQPDVYVVTAGTQSLNTSAARIPTHAPVWPLVRVAMREHPQLRVTCIDFDRGDAHMADRLFAELHADQGEPEIAYRGGARFGRRIRPQVAEPSPPATRSIVRSDRSYLITGGLGSLGLHVAGWLVDQGARHITLSSRRPPSAHAQDTIRKLQGSAQVNVECVDVADDAACAGLLERCASTVALGGIVHAAGLVDDGVMTDQSWSRFERVAAPKIQGAWNLHRLTADRALDFLVLFSSASATLGQPGQSNYAAANGFLDALAWYRRSAGLPATSINWGPWAGRGMADAVASTAAARWAEQGLYEMEPAAALAGMREVLAREETQQAIIRIDWQRYAARLSPLPRALSDLALNVSPAGNPEVGLLASLDAAPPVRRMSLLVDHVLRRATRVLGLGADYSLDVQEGLRNVGLDSLLAIELRNVLQSDIGVPLPVTLAFDHPTSDAIARHLAGLLNLDSGDVKAAANEERDLLADVESLDDDTVEAVLAAELAELAHAREQRS